MIEKKCIDCNELKPATLEYFYKCNQQKNGLTVYCKLCINKRTGNYREKNRAGINAQKREHYYVNKDELNRKHKIYRETNKERIQKVRQEKHQQIKHLPEQRFQDYKQASKRRKLDFGLTFEQFLEITKNECFYCGRMELGFSGIDRINNEQGYTNKNVVPCCRQCNYAKHAYTKEQFLEMCLAVCKHNNLV